MSKQQGAPKGSRAVADNPFETRKNRTKFAVLGRKVKGTVVHAGQARDAGQARRAATIGSEFETRGKTGAFVDRRFGERDAALTEAAKMDVRFQRERLRQTRNQFSLTEAEDLTHLGMTLGSAAGGNSLADDLFFKVNDDDAAFGGDKGLMDEQLVQRLHFGGGGGDDDGTPAEDRKRTKREVMDEIVAKSKQYRAQKRQDNAAHFELVQQLDEQLKDITPFLTMAPRATLRGKRRADAGDAEIGELEPTGEDQQPAPRETEEGYVPDEYDALVRELRVASREAHAGDRLQSRAEEAQARMARLRSLELMREQRMGAEEAAQQDTAGSAPTTLASLLKAATRAGRAEDGSEDEDGDEDDEGSDAEGGDDDGGDEGKKKQNKKKKTKERRRRVRRKRDVLGVDAAERGAWVLERRWARDMLNEEDGPAHDGALAQVVCDARTGEELPFVLPMPATAEELWELLDANDVSVGRVALLRILGTTDPALDPNHAARLRKLHGWLLASALRGPVEQDTEQRSAGQLLARCVAWSDMLFDAIRRLLLMMPNADAQPAHSDASVFFPYRVVLNVAAGVEPAVPSGSSMVDVEPLLPLKTEGRRKNKGANGAMPRIAYVDAHHYPSAGFASTLLQTLRVFSSSDRFHPVCTPALTYLLGVLATSVHVTEAHYMTSLLIADSVLEPTTGASRFAPEPFW